MKKMCLFILLVVGLFSCANENSHQDDTLVVLRKEKALWEQQQINHYRFIGSTHNTWRGPCPITMTVFPDKEPVITDNWESQYATKCDSEFETRPFYPVEGRTISEIYAYLENVLADIQGYSVGIVYNEKYHYPESFAISTLISLGLGDAYSGFSFSIDLFEDLRGK